jgi:hypothetical protein
MSGYEPIGDETSRWSTHAKRRAVLVGGGVLLVAAVFAVMIGSMVVTKPPVESMGGDGDHCPDIPSLNDYPAVLVYEFTVVDSGRYMTTGTNIPSGGNNTVRYIPGHVMLPATRAGTQKPVISLLPWINNGSLAAYGVTTRTTNRTTITDDAYTDAPAAPGQFRVVVTAYRGYYGDAIRKMESLVRAGFIVVAFWSEGLPIQPPTLANIPDVVAADTRFVKNSIKGGTFPGLTYGGNVAVGTFGCLGESLTSLPCGVAAAGTTAPQAGLPGINVPDYDFGALFLGDEYSAIAPNTVQNPQGYNGSLAIWSSGLAQDWNIDFPTYNRTSERIFYDVRGFDHVVTCTGIETRCHDLPRECGRVFYEGLATPFDVTDCGISIIIDWRSLLGQCDAEDLDNTSLIPNAYYTPEIASAIPKAPLSGLGYRRVLEVERYYIQTYFLHALTGFPALSLTLSNVDPGFISGVYDDSTPGYPANPFNLVSSRVQIDLVDNATHSDAFYAGFQGPIVLPPGSVNVYPTGSVIVSPDLQFNLSFTFPMRVGDVIQNSSHLYVNDEGFIYPLSSSYVGFGQREAPRARECMLLTGSPVMACYGTGHLAMPPNSTYAILNSPTEFTLTVINASMGYAQGTGSPPILVSYQCSLYPNGTRTFRFDASPPVSIPVRNPFIPTKIANADGTVIVGWSNGRAYVRSCGQYDHDRKPKITTWSDVLRGKDGRSSDAIFEVYTGGAPAQAA